MIKFEKNIFGYIEGYYGNILDWKSKNMGPRFVGQFKYCRFDWDSTSKMFEELTNKEIGTEVRHKIKINFKKSKVSDYEYLNHYQHPGPPRYNDSRFLQGLHQWFFL